MPRLDPALLVDVDPTAVTSALSEWHWLIGTEWAPLFVSTVGDVFLTDATGRVVRLDTGGGALQPVAASMGEFEARLLDSTAVADLFLLPVVESLQRAGKLLGPGQCYGFTILPIFKEGSYEADNRFALSALEHIRVTGDMHSQIKDVPDGQRIRLKIV